MRIKIIALFLCSFMHSVVGEDPGDPTEECSKDMPKSTPIREKCDEFVECCKIKCGGENVTRAICKDDEQNAVLMNVKHRVECFCNQASTVSFSFAGTVVLCATVLHYISIYV